MRNVSEVMVVEQYNENGIKVINEYQQQLYESYEERTRDFYLKNYSDILEKMKTRTDLKILDIGGASGHFAVGLYDYFKNNNCKIIVLDTAKYNTWGKFSDKVEFIEASADNIDTLYHKNEFDLIFANRVFHHFVRHNWKETVNGITEIAGKIYKILKPEGYFCIVDHFYNGFLYDEITSKIIYTLTICKILSIVKLCKKLGAESAGVGVCFLSKKMWINLLLKNNFKIHKLVENKKYYR
jgi:ubiquinone/menaquinone biosynthesis C-methylase UbiE